MSDQFNSFMSPVKKEVVDQIERLDLSTLQKLHGLYGLLRITFQELDGPNDPFRVNIPEVPGKSSVHAGSSFQKLHGRDGQLRSIFQIVWNLLSI